MHLFSRRTSLWPYQIGDISDAHSSFTSAADSSQMSAEMVLCSQCIIFNCTHKGAGVRYSHIKSRKETTCMQCRGQLRHEVTKKAIKAAVKLWMHVICYESHLRICLWNGFPNFPGAAQHCLPHLTHPIQLISSLVETLRLEMGQKR